MFLKISQISQENTCVGIGRLLHHTPLAARLGYMTARYNAAGDRQVEMLITWWWTCSEWGCLLGSGSKKLALMQPYSWKEDVFAHKILRVNSFSVIFRASQFLKCYHFKKRWILFKTLSFRLGYVEMGNKTSLLFSLHIGYV